MAAELSGSWHNNDVFTHAQGVLKSQSNTDMSKVHVELSFKCLIMKLNSTAHKGTVVLGESPGNGAAA